jgi:hypothetical protein
MQSFIKALRGMGPVGTFIANVVTFLTTNWVVTMTTIVSLYASTTDWLVEFIQEPKTQTFVLVFLSVLWTYIGIIYLIDRKRPVRITPAHDYRYGLTNEGLIPNYDPIDGALQFGIQLRNYSSGPIKYNVEQLEIRIGTRSTPKLKKNQLYGYLPRGGSKFSSIDPFNKTDLAEFQGKRVDGTADVIITYGHPEMAPVRRLKINMTIVLVFNVNGPLGFNGNIVEETDVDIQT